MSTVDINGLGFIAGVNNWQNTQKIDLIDDKYFYVTSESKFFLFVEGLILQEN